MFRCAAPPPVTSPPPTVPGTFPGTAIMRMRFEFGSISSALMSLRVDGLCNFEDDLCLWSNIQVSQRLNSNWTLGSGYNGGTGFFSTTGPSFDTNQIPGMSPLAFKVKCVHVCCNLQMCASFCNLVMLLYACSSGFVFDVELR